MFVCSGTSPGTARELAPWPRRSLAGRACCRWFRSQFGPSGQATVPRSCELAADAFTARAIYGVCAGSANLVLIRPCLCHTRRHAGRSLMSGTGPCSGSGRWGWAAPGGRVRREGDGFNPASPRASTALSSGFNSRFGRTGTWRETTRGNAWDSKRRRSVPTFGCACRLPRAPFPGLPTAGAAFKRRQRSCDVPRRACPGGRCLARAYGAGGRLARRTRSEASSIGLARGTVPRAGPVALRYRLARWMARCYARLEREGWTRLAATEADGSSRARDRAPGGGEPAWGHEVSPRRS